MLPRTAMIFAISLLIPQTARARLAWPAHCPREVQELSGWLLSWAREATSAVGARPEDTRGLCPLGPGPRDMTLDGRFGTLIFLSRDRISFRNSGKTTRLGQQDPAGWAALDGHVRAVVDAFRRNNILPLLSQESPIFAADRDTPWKNVVRAAEILRTHFSAPVVFLFRDRLRTPRPAPGHLPASSAPRSAGPKRYSELLKIARGLSFGPSVMAALEKLRGEPLRSKLWVLKSSLPHAIQKDGCGVDATSVKSWLWEMAQMPRVHAVVGRRFRVVQRGTSGAVVVAARGSTPFAEVAPQLLARPQHTKRSKPIALVVSDANPTAPRGGGPLLPLPSDHSANPRQRKLETAIRRALTTLGSNGIAKLLHMLSHWQKDVSAQAFSTLAALVRFTTARYRTDIVARMVFMLFNRDAAVRMAAANVVADLGDATIRDGALARLAREDREPEVRARAVRLLGLVAGDPGRSARIHTLIETSRDPDARVRREALEALSRSVVTLPSAHRDKTGARDAARKALSDSDQKVRERARLALERLRN